MAFSVGLFIAFSLFVEAIWIGLLDRAELPAYSLIQQVLWVMIPVSIAVAILRYRLYEIDRIVSRTVSYAVIALVLGAVWVGGLLALQTILPASGDLTVATSTLVAAALFSPLRQRVRVWVDRRFNRSRYDAGLIFEAFTSRLRDAVDLPTATDDLMAVVRATVEPTTASAQALCYVDPARIRLSLARLYLLTGRYREALTEFETVAATTTGETAARAEHGVGEVHRRLGRFDLALHHFHQAEADHPEPSLLYADWGMLALRSGDTDEAVRLARRSLAEAETQEDAEVMARAYHLLGVVSGDATTAQVQFEKALELATDSSQRMASLNGLARSISREGDHAAALPVAEEALDLAKTIGDRRRQAALHNHLADIHHGLGDVAGAEALVTESVRLFAEIEPDAWKPEIWLLTGW